MGFNSGAVHRESLEAEATRGRNRKEKTIMTRRIRGIEIIGGRKRAAKALALIATALCFALMLSGCGTDASQQRQETPTTAAETPAAQAARTDMSSSSSQEIESLEDMPDVTVRFGSSGKSFIFTPEGNETALYLVRNITSAGRNLPIYTYEDYEGADVMQYYDVPSRFDIPSSPTHVTSEKAGEVYLSAPNRIMLFYRDANMEGDLTYLGGIADIDGLADAVIDNPTVPGYSNKIISVAYEHSS